MRRKVLGILFVALCSTALWAQDTAQINGTVTDSTGAVLPGVEVTATQTATGLVRAVVTNETGASSRATVMADTGGTLWARGFSPVQSSRKFQFDLGTGLKPRAHR